MPPKSAKEATPPTCNLLPNNPELPATHKPVSADMVPQVLGSVPFSWFPLRSLQRVQEEIGEAGHGKHNVTAQLKCLPGEP
jgi:hypothetical protein